MHITAINGFQARTIINRIYKDLFSHPLTMIDHRFKHNYAVNGDQSYFDLRHSMESRVDVFVQQIYDLKFDISRIQPPFEALPLSVRQFFLDRVVYADEYFEQLATKFVFDIHTEEDLFLYALIELWHSRPRIEQWKDS